MQQLGSGLTGWTPSQMAALIEASRVFAETTTDYPALLKVVADQIAHLTGDGCTVRILSEDGEWLVPAAAAHLNPELEAAMEVVMGQTTQRSTVGIWQTVMDQRQLVRIAVDPHSLPATASAAQEAFLRRWPLRHIAGVPLVARGQLLGGLSLLRYGDPTPFSDDAMAMLQDLADRAALAIDNARLLEQARHELAKRERAEAQARERASELETLMQAMPAAVWIAHDPACQQITGNRVGNELWRAPEGANVSQSASPSGAGAGFEVWEEGRQVPPEQLPMHRAAAEGVKVEQAHLQLRFSDGSTREVVGSASPLFTERGTSRGSVAVFLDVTEHEKVRARLARTEAAEQWLRTVAEAVGVGIMVRDASGAVVHLNPQAQAMIGQTESQLGALDHQLFWEVLSEDGSPYPAAEHPDFQALRRGRPYRQVLQRVLLGNGTVRWFLVDAVPLPGPDGTVTHVVVSFVDMTEQQHLQQQLLQAQRLEMAGKIAGQVAHDFNNLLTPLMGYPELIKMRIPADETVIGFCDHMIEAAQRIAEINDELLTLGRRGQTPRLRLELNPLVDAVISELDAPPATLSIQRELQPDLLPVQGASAQLFRVILNLVSNGREAMRDVGTLTVQTYNCSFDEPTDEIPVGTYVCLEVHDTGPGIPEEVLPHIFDPFFTTDYGKRRGAGLGLTIVRSVVADHDGFIDLDTRLGMGTIARIYLPASSGGVIPEPVRQMVGGPESILVVDDDPFQRETARHLLVALGYSVETVPSGEAALELLQDRSVDLLILDMVMPPGIDGAETLRRVWARDPLQRAIVVTGYANPERLQEVQQLGIGSCVRKPARLEELAQAVRAALDRPAPTGQAAGLS